MEEAFQSGDRFWSFIHAHFAENDWCASKVILMKFMQNLEANTFRIVRSFNHFGFQKKT
jgi:hypothetical protein